MKNSKILIFILSVILLIVVIKFMKGSREGFIATWAWNDGEGSAHAMDTNDEKHLKSQIVSVGDSLNLAIVQINSINDELSAYATKAELSAYATKAELSAYATKAELSAYATNKYVDDIIGI
jgi:hypothetical protein